MFRKARVLQRLDHVLSLLPHPVRSRHLRTITMVVLMALAAGTTLRSLQSASAAQSGYGHRQMTTIASRDLPIGHVISSDDIERRELPEALIPGGRKDERLAEDGANPIDEPIGRTVIEPIIAGEVLLSRRISGSRASGLPAVVPGTNRVVSIERSALMPTLRPGDRVDVCAPGVGARAVVISRRALVVDVDEDSVTVSVTDTELPAVARSIIDGDVIVALIGER
jgi:Flp pilus assembly protein CpaB